MPTPRQLLPIVTAAVLVSACGGGDSATAPRPANQVDAQGGTVLAQNGAVALTFPAGAIGAATAISVTPMQDPSGNANVVAGTVYDFGPDGTQFAQPVKLDIRYDAASLPAGAPHSALRIAKLVDGAWQPLAEGVAIDSVGGRISASIRSFSSYSVFVVPCVPFAIGVGTNRGQLLRSDCVSSTNGHRSDYYNLTVPAGQVISIQTSGALTGVVGIKAHDLSDPRFGHSWLSTIVGGSMRLVSNGTMVQIHVTGADSTHFGDYTVALQQQALAHSCDTDTYLMAGVSFAQTLTASNSCSGTIRFSPNPSAIGKPILMHYYGVRLEAGRGYTVRVTGLNDFFNPALTIFHGGAVYAQSATDLPTSRTVTITPAVTGLYVIELSSGMFTPTGNWVTPSGNYTLSVSGS